MKNKKFLSILNILTLCVVIFAISAYFVSDSQMIGFVIVGLGVFCLLTLIPFKIKVKTVWPDIVFGIIDNGILAIIAIVGGEIGGILGAVVGGVVGNAITDGIAGIFEGLVAEKMKDENKGDQRTMLGSAVGKMAGCLLAAGAVLIIANAI